MSTAELRNHTKEHDRDGLIVEEWRAWFREGAWTLITWQVGWMHLHDCSFVNEQTNRVLL